MFRCILVHADSNFGDAAMYRSFTYTIAALFLMAGMAGSASASQILSVAWDVTSGSITGDFFGMQSPITSGSVVWTAPTATAVFTPVVISGGTGTLKIDLYTAGNKSLHAVGLAVTGLTIDAQNFFASFVLGSGEAATFSSLAPLYNFSGFLQFIATGYGSGSGTTFSSGSLFASFVLGNEVRTYATDPGGNGGDPAIPEPTAALAFGVGFTLVALYSRKLRMSA